MLRSSRSLAAERALLPDAIVRHLDRFIVGQRDAKRAVAVALRTRWRRKQLPPDLQREVSPANILLCGPTGCGKTEIARRLASLVDAPFTRVEATRYTEVGFHGVDPASMVKDLADAAVQLEQSRRERVHRDTAQARADQRVLTALGGAGRSREALHNGDYDDETVVIELKPPPAAYQEMPTDFSSINMEELVQQTREIFERGPAGARGGGPALKTQEKISVRNARTRTMAEELDQLVDSASVAEVALRDAEENGIIFIDEIDKLAGSQAGEGGGSGHWLKGAGVQKELLALTEGSAVTTKHGVLRTDHVLFIASGAFHLSRPSDLLPELQGRLPVRVTLGALSEADLLAVLTETEFNLVQQQRALLRTEGVEVTFSDCAAARIARYAAEINRAQQDIGARRLNAVMAKIVEDISFDAANLPPELEITEEYIEQRLGEVVGSSTSYIL